MKKKTLIGMPDSFFGKITKVGHSMYVLVPKSIIAYGGYKKGDELKIWIKKTFEKEVEDE